jgi:hypothetical protein
MAKFAGAHRTAAGANLTVLALESTATIRGKIYDMVIGSDSAPNDAASRLDMLRFTVLGTGGTAVVEKALDPTGSTPACNLRGGTMTESGGFEADFLLEVALNQRATFRWVAAPGSELITAAGATNGIALRCISISTGTPNINTTLMWEE